ncbi:FAD-dependent monooxygenase [Bradyrhizobium pachyrhizi]|uniref:FAD-dependent monooxygenase n=1 Tax=Bradyrhizobium pachyrhizi TaxID=280333 RepID=UPI000405DECD|nr:FAD-dependent monooxygenase [Bradyrhizobium pachyrhizi]WFU55177.1 FAD-dependent monooxygenase [Bradyrhizobium pachyrhizi]
MSIEQVSKSSVLIAGAGIGGLAMALSLLRRGIDCDILEQSSELREVGAGLWISMNGVRVLRDLALTEQVEQNCIAAERRDIRLWSNGESWPLYDRSSDAAGNQPYLLLRAHLLKILVEGVRRLKPSAIHLNAHVVGFIQDDEGVRAKLADGTEIQGHALIGADGAHSKVRLGLIGNIESEYTNAIAWRGLVPVERLAPHQREHVVSTWIGPTAHVTAYPVKWQDTQLMTFSGQVDRADWLLESWSEKGSVKECLGDFQGWHSDIIELIRNVDTLNKWGLFVRPSLETWSKGRVTLLGDACHSMLPYLGQGVNMALEDASVLARCFDDQPNDLAKAFRTYQDLRLDRTSRVVKSAAGMLPVFHNPALNSVATAGDYIKTQWAPSATAARYDWIYQYDATTVPLH